MALAYLHLEDTLDELVSFHADTGSNRYYRYKIGKEKSTSGGLEQIEKSTFASQLLENAEQSNISTAFQLAIPKQLFDQENRFIQLYSFRKPDGEGPAVSKVIEVNAPELSGNVFLSLSRTNEITYHNMPASPFNPCRSAAFSFSENKLSKGLFLEALLQIAGNLAPHISQAVAGLVNRTGASGGNVSGDTILQLINGIINALPRSGTTPAAAAPVATIPAPTAPATTPTQAPSQAATPAAVQQSWLPGYPGVKFKPKRSNVFALPPAHLRNGKTHRRQNNLTRGMIVDGGIITGPLLAAAIGPLLQSAPQLIQAIGDLPLRLMAIRSQERIQRQQGDQEYILRLLQGIEQQENMEALLRVLGTGATPSGSLSTTPNHEFQTVLQKTNPLEVNGKQKYVYFQKSDITFLLNLETQKQVPDRGIPRVKVDLTIKNPDTLQPLLEKSFRFEDVKIGTSLGLTLSAAEIEKLPGQSDLLVSTNFRWKGRDNKIMSLTDNHVVFLVKGSWLQQVGERVGNEIALMDPVEYKVFWNKIWESPATGGRRWKANFETRYYFYYQPNKSSNARVETKIKINTQQSGSSERRLELNGRLKSALEYSPEELNKLLPRLGSKSELPVEQLEAFKSNEFSQHFNLQATANVELKGKENEQGCIWVFPEITLRRFILSGASQTEATGQIVKTLETDVEFPIPSSAHFVGALTV
ncbi:MAG: hypothetical protein IT270_05900 [Saprospiraceae bacterium]|nr:hypothetical protein [Saprospiraceae bacterium]